jgi:hypothetical protein
MVGSCSSNLLPTASPMTEDQLNGRMGECVLESMGWKVLRFTDKDVEVDAEAVARAIARELNLDYEFRPRKASGSGMRSINTTPRK